MAKLVKLVLILIAAVVGVGVIAAVALVLFFDPNDYKTSIASAARDATGRELTIEGDLSLSLFPWLALEAGRTSLGNAEGFGDEPMVSFDSARLSVRLMPLLVSQEVRVGTAALEGFVANLAVAADGRTNWADLAEATDAAAADVEPDASPEGGGDLSLDIANVELRNARINYSDAQSGSRYTLSDVNLNTGRIAVGEAFGLEGRFDVSAMPADIRGNVTIDAAVLLGPGFESLVIDDLSVDSTVTGVLEQATDIRFDARSIAVDTLAGEIRPGEMDLAFAGLAVNAQLQPINYAAADTPTLQAKLSVSEFSLKELMPRLGIEAPATADPNALKRVSFDAAATVDENALTLSDMSLILDDTTMNGTLSVPLADDGTLSFDLRADSINVDNYMAPAVEGEATAPTAEASDVEIPVDLIRALKANGRVSLEEAFVGPVRFTGMQLGVDAGDGRLRLHPINASFFEGKYEGDVRIDASGDQPTLSVNENISGVSIASLMRALYEVENLTGTINAGFQLAGGGASLNAIASDLDGSMRFELLDGVWQGVDIWQQLRTARALYKRETPPEPRLPPRTEFTSINASGSVIDGVFANDDLVALLPFVRVTGAGMVDLAARELDYSVQARILDTPEFMNDASDEELADFTEALIPIRISGALASPTFRPDIEAVFRQEVERAIDEKKDELREEIFNRVFGEDDETDDTAGEGADTAPSPEQQLEDELKNKLRELFPR